MREHAALFSLSKRGSAVLVVLAAFGLCVMSSAPGADAQVTTSTPVFGPQTYTRTTGAPNEYTTTFNAPAWIVSPYNLHIVNGDVNGNNRVSSATITLNEVQVAGTSDFNQNVAIIDRSVTLQSTNTLQVTLASKPGSYLTINVFGTNADHTPPQIKIVTPAASSHINTATPNIEATYSDPVGVGEPAASGVSTSTFKATLDGVDRTSLFTVRSTDASAAIPPNLALTAGTHTLVISLSDNAGNQATATSQFTVDLSPPLIQIVRPALGVYLNSTTPTINIQYSDNEGLNLASLKVVINGTDLTSLFTKTNSGATATLPARDALPNGANQIVAQIQDLAGTQSSASTSFNIDTTPPTISFSHPMPNSYLGSSSVQVIVQYADDQAIDTSKLNVMLDGVPLAMTISPASATAVATGMANGTHILLAAIKDLAGNVGSAQITFYVDTTIPTIHVSQPAPNALLNTHTPLVSIDYTDVSGVDLTTLKVFVNGAEATSLFTANSTTATGQLANAFALPDGQNTIVAQIVNLAGSVGVATSTFLVDTTPPTIAFQAPPPRTNSNTPTVTIVYADATSGVDPSTLVVTLDGADISTLVAPGANSATGVLQLRPLLADGTHVLTATVKDRAGNQSSPVSLSFVVDTTPPVVSFKAPLDNSFINNPTPTIILQYSDGTGVGVDTTSVKVFLQQGTNLATDITTYFQIGPQQATGALPSASPLTDGTYVLTAVANDLVGNTGNVRATLVLDTVPPTGAIQTPAANAILNTSVVAVTLLYQDDRSGVDTSRLVLTIDGINQTSVLTLSPTQATGTLPPLPDGVHTIQLTVFDRSGNSSGVISQTFETDTTPPTIAAAVSPTPNAAGWNNANVTVIFSCGDATSGVAICPPPQIVATEGADQIIAGTATDNAGNMATVSVTLNIAKTPPRITVMPSPAANAAGWNNSNVTVNSVCTVTTAPIATCPSVQTVSTEGAGQIISGTVVDVAGNSTSASATINLDNTPPTVVITSPSANAVLNNPAVAVSGTVSDALSGVAAVSCNGAPAVLSAGTFSCSLSLPAGPNTIFVQATDVAGNSATSQITVTVQLSTAAKLVFSTEPGNGVAGTLLASVVVQVQDANGNVVTGSSASITISSMAAGVSGATTVKAVNGVVTFSKLVFTMAGNYTLTAASAGITSATSTPFTISAGAAAQLVFSTEPTNGTAGSPLARVVVQVQDGDGNVVTNSNAMVTIISTAAGVGGTTTVAAVNGVATFSNLMFTTAGSYALTAASSGATSATSTPFTISAGAAAALVFSTEPRNGVIESPLGNVVVQVQDTNGNLVTSSNASITISSMAAGVGGTTTVVAVNGVETFSNLVFTTAGSYTLTAASAGITSATSTPFTISLLGPTSLVFTMQPPPQVQTGQLLLPGPQVTLENPNGAVLTSYNGPVTISIGNNPSRATLSGTLTQNAISGVATFLDLSLNTAGNGYTLLASAAGQSATSAQFNVRVSPQLASCAPTGSLSVLLPPSGGGSVTAYVPNGSWSDGHSGIQVVPIEGGGSPAVISTPNPVNSCASNSATGETVCVANTTDVYLISGSTLNSTLTSGSTGITVQFDPPTGLTSRPPKTPFLTGGWCLNCGVAINAVTNTAAIEMGLTSGLPPFYSGLQFLDLSTNTFSAPFPLANDITEDMQWDSIRNLILLPSEYDYPTFEGNVPFFGLTGGNYDLIDTSTGTPTEFGRLLPGANLDAAAEDCTTGIALAGIEGTLPPPAQYPTNLGLFISDLTQTAFTTGSPGTWSAPGQFVGFPEFLYLNYATGAETPSVSVPPGSHLAVVTSEGAGDGLAVVELPSASGSGTPGFGDYAVAALPRTPDGQSWSQGFDPHTITAYVSPNTGRPMAIFANSSPPTWLAVIDLQGLLDAPRKAGVLPNNLGIPCPNCTHTVDPSYDLLTNNVVRYIGTPPQIKLVCPTTGQAGQQLQLVNLTGNHTHWTQGITTASFGAGITVESLDVQDPTQIAATISIDPAAALGPRTVVTVTDSEVAIATNPYTIEALASVAPSTGQQGQQNLTVTLTGQFTNWVRGEPQGGVTQVSLGAGVNLASQPTVNSPTSMTAVLNIDPSAPVGPRPLTIAVTYPGKCDTQIFTGFFTVTAGALILESVNPNSGQQGQQNFSVTLTGSGTNWVQGLTTADFGPGITVALLTMTSPTSATAVLNIGPNAAVGAQTVTMTTGNEVETRVNGFIVTSVPNPLMVIQPNTGQQGQQNLSVNISDDFTSYWVPGVTTVSFGPGITVSSLTVNATVSATAVLSIDPSAPTGPRNVTVTTGAEIDILSNGFTVTPANGSLGTPAQVVFVGQPTNTTAGQPISAVTVAVEDAFGNVISTASNTVSLFTSSGSASGTLLGTTSQPAINGVATFGDLTISKTGGYAFQASSPGLSTPRLSNAFAITAGPATQLVFTKLPTTVSAGQPVSVEVAVEDALGNIVTSATNPVSLTLTANPSGPTLSGATTLVPSAGIALFSVSINKTGAGYSFTASSPGLTSTSSTSFVVNLGPPSQLVFLTQPISVALNATMNPVQVAVEDSSGNVVPSASGVATIALFQNPSGGTLSGALSAPLVNGIAAFPGLSINKAGQGDSLVADVAGLGLPPATSNSFTVGGPASVVVNLSDEVVAPDGIVTVTPVALDGGGSPINDPSLQFNISVSPNGLTSGNAPVIQGNTITFPKLIKRLLNQDLVNDPNGEFADGDPTDPNYGKETGGSYRIMASLVGSSLNGTADVIVLPTGTASITAELYQYANQLSGVMNAAKTAIHNNDAANLAKAHSDLRALMGNTDFSAGALRANNVIAPPNGWPATVAQLDGMGFMPAPDDNAFANTAASIINQVQLARAGIDQIDITTLSQADIDALTVIRNNYQNLTQQFSALKPSPLGVTQQAANLNALFAVELPLLLDSAEAKAEAILQQLSPITTAQARLPKRITYCGRLQPIKFVQGTAPWQQSAGGPNASRRPHVKLALAYDLISLLFDLVTDEVGASKGNIIELGASLANDLINQQAANIINSFSSGGLQVDFVQASSSVAFVCPNYIPTTVDGTGFSMTPGNNAVMLIGCFDSQLLRSLLTLKYKPNMDLAAKIRLIKKLFSIGKALLKGVQNSSLGLITADIVQPGIFEGELELVFSSGWPRTNLSRIICVGVVTVFNLDTGDFQAVNLDFIPTCQ